MATDNQRTRERIKSCRRYRRNVVDDTNTYNSVQSRLSTAEEKLSVLRGELDTEKNLLNLATQVAKDAAMGAIPVDSGRRKRPGIVGAAIGAAISMAGHKANVARLESAINRRESIVRSLKAEKNALKQMIRENNREMDSLRCGELPLN